LDEETIKERRIFDWYCPTKRDYGVRGAYYSQVFDYVEIKVEICKSGANCPPNIDKIIESANLNIIFINRYLDFTSYDEPIKSFLEDEFYYKFDANRRVVSNIYIKKNEAAFSDDIW